MTLTNEEGEEEEVLKNLLKGNEQSPDKVLTLKKILKSAKLRMGLQNLDYV